MSDKEFHFLTYALTRAWLGQHARVYAKGLGR